MIKRNRLVSAMCVGCSVLMASQSLAATIEPGPGDLTINRGQGFKPVTSRINANVGDSVMVGPGGTATVVYDDGCKISVQPGAVTTIAPLSPCASGSNAQDGNWWTGLLIFGGAVGGIIGIILASHNGPPKPASP